ncbi:DUF3800 domain-containing protein [Pseudarthrobacter sp. BRE9]|uniref:DUF3800 domain-containing protein n=1 Tax=Pseudarthrobacter sp. BRE9 TaxID=2962582 RepID=UPI0028827485|nr:DUF3800 domain-containing protein [Pseudarthrobacter sp. BRE9]MDT0168878.1 DUF3800 domain-containing protein [Pseudarthrobacter sp. BRE9]
MAAAIKVAEIFCDESGHDGENLMGGKTPVLAHSSLYMELGEANELVTYLRAKTKAQSPELKAADILRNGQAINDLFGDQGKLVGKVQVYLVEKANMAAGKMIDLLIEERAYADGHNFYDGTAQRMATALYELGPENLGQEQWLDLVSAFTSLMREKQRKGEKETIDGFFEKVQQARSSATNGKLKIILTQIAATRQQAEEFQADLAKGDLTKNLDPLQTSLMELAYGWSRKLQRPIRIMHDAQNGLTEKVMGAVMAAATKKVPAHFNLPNRNFDLRGITHIDSKADPRIQLADIAAGFTRQVAESALKGNAEEERLSQVQRLVHYNSIWGDEKSWEQICPRDWPFSGLM